MPHEVHGSVKTSTARWSVLYPELLIGKTFWKNIVLPLVFYGINIINLTEDNINELHKIENSVYRSILGAAHYSPNVTLRGEIGTSLVKKRVRNGRINYIKGIQSNRNKLLETILWTIENEQETKWIKTTREYMNVTNINFNDNRLNSKEYLKQFMIKWDRNIWEDELEMKTRLQIYKKNLMTLAKKKFMIIGIINHIIQSENKYITAE